MALVRILVDGYSLLHHWVELAPQHPRYSQAAREELISILRLYQDAVGTPVTIVFDGATSRGSVRPESSPELEILYTRTGQTADQVIERVVHRMQPYGEVLAVTNDIAERETVISLGGMASSCDNFVRAIESALNDLNRDIHHHNRRERERFSGSKP
jgi:predicted RNA-binding protein with PIN domain